MFVFRNWSRFFISLAWSFSGVPLFTLVVLLVLFLIFVVRPLPNLKLWFILKIYFLLLGMALIRVVLVVKIDILLLVDSLIKVWSMVRLLSSVIADLTSSVRRIVCWRTIFRLGREVFRIDRCASPFLLNLLISEVFFWIGLSLILVVGFRRFWALGRQTQVVFDGKLNFIAF